MFDLRMEPSIQGTRKWVSKTFTATKSFMCMYLKAKETILIISSVLKFHMVNTSFYECSFLVKFLVKFEINIAEPEETAKQRYLELFQEIFQMY